MRPRDLDALELPRVLARLADFAASTAGKEACRALRPSLDPVVAEREVERTWQCFRLLEEHGEPALCAFPDVRGHLRTAAHEGYVLDGRSLVEVRVTLRCVRELGVFFRRHVREDSALADLPASLAAFPTLESTLARALDDEGVVLDEASDELAGVRASIRRLRDTLTRRLEHLVARQSMADVVADSYVTLRNDRFVVPVRSAAAGRMGGVVQDRSVSGETVFVEPLFAVELNNQLLMAVREEEAIVRRILADLTALVRAERESIERGIEALVGAECLIARARFGRAYRCTRPRFGGGAIRLAEARHAGLLLTDRPVAPIDIALPADRAVLVVTGPNTGGKTVALKTLGLCALMAQSGLLVPAGEGAEMPCFAAIFTDIGDEQSIERDLSTFSAHIANLCEILASDVRGPLVLLDEPGVGTDPEEGAALAVGLLEELERRGARLAVTTHYTPVKTFALERESCVVAAVDFDVETLTPHYRLVYHSLGRSLALPIARRLGLPAAVLQRAEKARSEQSRAFGTALEQLEATRRRLESELAAAARRASELAAEEAESRRLLDTLRERRRSAWRDELREAREFLRELKAEGREHLKALRAAAEQRVAFEHFVRRRERDVAERETAPRIERATPSSPGPPRPGDTVEVGDRRLRGELLAVDGARAWIQRGTLRFEVPADQLRRVGRPEPAPPVRVRVASREEAPLGEISLIGLRARDAVARLDSFLDRALQAQQESVRIVHGLGSGALRRAVHDYLSASPYCAEFHSGEGQGGGGVTVARIAR
jgi:DNA mismatch repair protein MutS2